MSSQKRNHDVKYYFLKQWESEYLHYSASMEMLLIKQNLVLIKMKPPALLYLVLAPQNAYPFFSDTLNVPEGMTKLWPKLENTQCTHLNIAENDRILYFHLVFKDIYQQQKQYVLIAELMPPKPNLIWAEQNGEQLRIIDAIVKYGYADNPQRQVLPGLPYVPPKTTITFSPTQDTLEYPEGIHTCNAYFNWHYQNVLGVQKQQQTLLQQQQMLKQQWDKLQRKYQRQAAELEDAGKVDYYLACAEALKPRLSEIKPGQNEITAINYLDASLADITIPLLPDKSPRENLNHYLRKYHKAKNGLQHIKNNFSSTQAELDLTQDLLSRSRSGELLDLHIDKQDAGKIIKLKDSLLSKLLTLKIGENWQIVIGRKAKENDFITTELAKPHDWWFHSRIYHGAHVLLRCLKKIDPDDTLIDCCASLAAWYSKAMFSTNVPVDYTQIRFVRKPRKSAPGFVTYTNHHSVYASPRDIRSVREQLAHGQKET